MITLKDVILADGSIYHNLIFDSNWENLSTAIELQDAEIVFYEKHGRKFHPLCVKTEDILEVAKYEDEDYEIPNCSVLHKIDDEQVTFFYEPTYTVIEYEDGFYYGPERLYPPFRFCEKYFYNAIKDYKFEEDDADNIIDNLLEVFMDLAEDMICIEDTKITEKSIMVSSYGIAFLVAAFANERLSKDREDKLLRGDIDSIEEAFIEFSEEYGEDEEDDDEEDS